ncbi:MAG: hypothetical protein PHF00_08085 [Elusimicrobia bacterium]|nr:hypothetical protein [Elusimicrobiota bacterium]
MPADLGAIRPRTVPCRAVPGLRPGQDASSRLPALILRPAVSPARPAALPAPQPQADAAIQPVGGVTAPIRSALVPVANRNADPTAMLSSLYDGGQLGGEATLAPAPEPPAPASGRTRRELGRSPAWAAIERVFAQAFGLSLTPGKTAAWARATRDVIRNNPDIPLETALARALVRVHSLNPADVGKLVDNGNAMLSLPHANVTVMTRNRHGLYAVAERGVYLLRNGAWTEVLSGWGFFKDNVRAHEDNLIVSGENVYEIELDRSRVVDVNSRGINTPVRYEQTTYLPLKRGGFAEKDISEPWRHVKGLSLSSGYEVFSVAVAGGRLYAGTNHGLYVKTTGIRRLVRRWQYLGLKGHSINNIFEYNGKLFVYFTDFSDYRHRDRILVYDGETFAPSYSRNVDNFLKLGERLYVQSGTELLEFDGRDWRKVIDDLAPKAGRDFWSNGYFFSQGRLCVNGRKACYMRDAAGWSRVPIPVDDGPLVALVDHAGTRYAATTKGAYAVQGEDWIPLLKDENIAGIVVHEDRPYVGTSAGVKALLPRSGLPQEWRRQLIDEIGADILDAQRVEHGKNPAAPPVTRDEAGRIVNEDGNPLFGG